MNNHSPLLSVIIPVYNVERYVKECVLSVLDNCDRSSLQVILVDDGSTDNSSAICDELAKNYQIEVWHKKNGGLASARNYGLKKAAGKYIAFVDGDDKVSNMGKVQKYLAKHNSDVYFMNITKFFPDGHTEDMGENIEKNHLKADKTGVLKYLSMRNKFPASACGKIYRHGLLTENRLRFPDDNRISEDLGFALDVIRQASSFDKIELPYYDYRQNRENSITNTVSSNSFFGVAKFVSDYNNRLSATHNEDDDYLLGFVAYEYMILLWLYSFVAKKERRKAKAILLEHRSVLKYGKTKRIRIIRAFTIVLGISLTSKILSIVQEKRK